MKLTFYGACHEVTGSMCLLRVNDSNILIDCGMEQGKDEFENQTLKVAPDQIDAVVITHAHIDHTGNIPLLVKNKFRGPIYSTQATKALCSIMLKDSAHIQESEVEWKNRKRMRKGQPPLEALYTMKDAEEALRLFEGLSYGEKREILPGVVLSYVDAGHLLGSGSACFRVTENGEEKTIVFSGDIGNTGQPILKDPVYVEKADYVVMESTYGDRSHGERVDYEKILTKILTETFEKGGNVVVPSFAVGRTQEMLYFLRSIKEKGAVKGHEDFKVVVDSPLAVQATEIFEGAAREYFDAQTLALLRKGINPLYFDGLVLSTTTEESKAINLDREPKVILSASGMCEAGRIRHHLKHNLYRKESTILFVGYQGEGTLGRVLLDGAETVRLFGETIRVQARIERMPSISGHADEGMLKKWVGHITPKPQRVFVVHGEDEVCMSFANDLQEELGLLSLAPYSGECWDLREDRCLAAGRRIALGKDEKGKTASVGVHDTLMESVYRLERLAKGLKGHSNREQKALCAQIKEMLERWEKE